MEDQKSKISRSSNRIRINRDEKREDEGSVGLASFKKSQEYTEVCKTSQLL